MDHVMFLLFRAYFITLMTVGMMASLTEFRFGAPGSCWELWQCTVPGWWVPVWRCCISGENCCCSGCFDYHFSAGNGSYLLGANDTPTQAVSTI